MLGAPVPKTAIDKHRCFAQTMSQIRLAKNISWVSFDFSKACEWQLIQKRTLKLGVFRFDGRHCLGPLRWRPVVHGRVD